MRTNSIKLSFVYILSLLAIVSCLQEERSPEEILVPSPTQVDCSEASLVLTSKVPKGSEKLVEECGFYYGKEKSMANAAKLPASIEVNNFTAELPSREYGSTYYICSFVTNGHGSEIRSEVSSYSLKDIDKYIQFEPIELISYNKAETTAEVTFDAEIWSGVKVSEVGVCFGVTTSPATEGRHVKGEMTEEGTVSVSLEKFATDKEYYLRAYVRDGDYTAYGEVTPFTIKLLPPTLSSVIVSSVKAASATFSSAVTSDGGDKVVEVGFYYSTDEAVNPETSFKVNQPYSSDSFSLEATNLKANTKYYVKSFAINSIGASYSEVVSFTTSAAAPSVTTLGATEVTESGALLSGNVTSDNGAEITERGFVWMEGTGNPTTESNKLKVSGQGGEYTATLEGLDPNKSHSFRAYAINAEGMSYGDVMNFTTKVTLPALSGVIISSITSSSATLASKVANHGGDKVTEVGFYYSTDSELNLETAVKVSLPYSEDSFSMEVSELLVNTKYYVKSFAKNSVGTQYSEVETFTTSISYPTVKTVGFSDITSTSVLLSGIVVSDNGAAITERGFVWLQGAGTPTTDSFKLKVDGTTGEYTASLEGLNSNQKYSFRAYAINSKGTSYGDILTFSTVAGLPTLSAMKVSDITTTSATFTCTVTSHGGETVSEVGFYYGKDEELDVETAQKVTEEYSSDSFSLTVKGLEIGQEYYVKAYTRNSVGEVYSVIFTFKTISTAPTVITTESSEITPSSVRLIGEVADDNGESITERGFVWVKGTGIPTTSSNKLQVEGSLGEFSASLKDLEPNQTYSYCAYAINSIGVSYGETKIFKTSVALPEVVCVEAYELTSSSVKILGKVVNHGGETISEVGILYGTTSDLNPITSSKVVSVYTNDSFNITLTSLSRVTEYYIQLFATNSAGSTYGEILKIKTLPELPEVITNDVTDISNNSAKSGGVIIDDGGTEILSKGLVWSKSNNPIVEQSLRTDEGGGADPFTSIISELTSGTTYYVRAYATNSVGTSYGELRQLRTTGYHVEYLESSNCFIVSESGTYTFNTVRGHSDESVGNVESAEVLWESYGTDEEPIVGSLISSVSVQNGSIVFEVSSPYHEGNAVIAAKDASGTILWSWHIWLTDQPQEQIYYNNAGTMMDRNLGATSATPGDVGALGLLYQWGRKDPFLGSSSINSAVEAKSTIEWPHYTSSRTMQYAIEHPTTYLVDTNDWQSDADNSNPRWQKEKTIYDPCPAGWRIPDGDGNSVWQLARGVDPNEISFDISNQGINFSKDLGDYGTIWYPAAGSRMNNSGKIILESSGYYWSANTTYSTLEFSDYYLNYSSSSCFSKARSVRCFKEGTGGGLEYDSEFSISGAIHLSQKCTANSYIVSKEGVYCMPVVKGNSSESVGSASSAEVIWESFGTDERIFIGDLIRGAKYENGNIYFKTAASFREGNAVIAAKDASGAILWSWHIWLTDQPKEQMYHNNDCIMMDRNLGATSASVGDVGALGLLYQWGRKDPFLGASSISETTKAKSTINWPSAVLSEVTTDYAIANPTTYIKARYSNSQSWYDTAIEEVLWSSEKTIYDPCPEGWRVPDGGDTGVWYTAGFTNVLYDNLNKGGIFGISSSLETWYPAPGTLSRSSGELQYVGREGVYLSVRNTSAYKLVDEISFGGGGTSGLKGGSVRCFKEGSGVGPYNKDFSTSGAISLSDAGTANSYIVSESGTYSLSAVKGNSSETVGSVVSATVLWESFGTSETPSKCDLIDKVKYENGNIYFQTPDTFREGNAVIAAKDASGVILWSWHIWLTDRPQEHIYNNGAGTMMDRNLGATSATPGDVGTLGLVYQWGRKDPFLGSSSISEGVDAKSTINWPEPIRSSSTTGSIDYVTSHPINLICLPERNEYYDWQYLQDDTRWQSNKTIYDPCPAGWRVPDGGENGIWNVADFSDTPSDRVNYGKSFNISTPSTTWYPASGYREYSNQLSDVGDSGRYWSVTPVESSSQSKNKAYDLYFLYYSDFVDPVDDFPIRINALSVRCQKE